MKLVGAKEPPKQTNCQRAVYKLEKKPSQSEKIKNQFRNLVGTVTIICSIRPFPERSWDCGGYWPCKVATNTMFFPFHCFNANWLFRFSHKTRPSIKNRSACFNKLSLLIKDQTSTSYNIGTTSAKYIQTRVLRNVKSSEIWYISVTTLYAGKDGTKTKQDETRVFFCFRRSLINDLI